MRISLLHALSLAFFVFACAPMAGAADEGPRIADARTLFEQYVARSGRFDPAVTELYLDEARIVAHRIYPDGAAREMRLTGAEYKTMIRMVMPLARLRDDRSEYSDVTYTPEGQSVRIDATRRSLLKGYHAPHSMLVAPGRDGRWKIYEEIITTRP